MTIPPIDVRLSNSTAQRVRSIAAIEHRSLADTVRLLTEEAIKPREFPDIVFTNGPTGSRASFRRGPDVWEVLEPYLVAGKDWSVLRESYPDLNEATLHTTLRYYENYPDEIEARVDLNIGRRVFDISSTRI